jgi:hypothetical protein
MADGYGNFQFVGLGPGVHRVSVAAPGYRSTQVSYDVGSMFETLVVRLEELQR